MKTTVVPAQVTTVEDKIAGNFTFPQIVLFIIALLVGTAIYILIPPKTNFTVGKLILIVMQLMLFGGLAIRYKDKIIADWLIIILRYNSRPKRYVFTKNDTAFRKKLSKLKKSVKIKKTQKKIENKAEEKLNYHSQNKVDQILVNPKVSISFKPSRKGGLDVSFESSKR
ncbi:MAG: PrgI family protein [Bacteroidales bacterium]|nr:PrgI family protein [Bacteroidales bacterium]